MKTAPRRIHLALLVGACAATSMCMQCVSAEPQAPVHNQRIVTAKEERERYEWVARCLKDMESIKVGMTRRDVDKALAHDGGISSYTAMRYVHRECPYFKIRVEFKLAGPKDTKTGRTAPTPDDEVTGVSKPYLESPFID